MGRFIDETGHVYGNLRVLDLAAALPGNPGARWLCRCACGREIVIRGRSLRYDRPEDCGTCAKIKHEHSKTPEYTAWFDMLKRCENPAAANYRYYGAKGISVCARWRKGTAKLHPF